MKSGSIRTLLAEKQEYYQQKIPEIITQLENEIVQTNNTLPQLDTKSPNYLHDKGDIMARIQELRQQLTHYKSRIEEHVFNTRVTRLLKPTQTKTPLRTLRQRFLLQFFPNMTPPVTVPSEVCIYCGSSCILKRNIARLTCIACGKTRKIITNLNGSSQPYVLSFPSSATAAFYNTTSTTSSSSSSSSSGSKRGAGGSSSGGGGVSSLHRHEHVRMKWLYKQLQQYRIGSKKVPKEIIFAVARRLRSLHLKSVSVVKHTITRSILKALDKNEWTSQSSKIADVCNGTPVAAFNDAQFLIVIKRLLAVQKVYIFLKEDPNASEKLQRVNFPPSQFLLKQFCILEKWDDLQECFTHSKTFEVYQGQISEWRIFLPLLKIKDPWHHNWDYADHRNDLDALRLL